MNSEYKKAVYEVLIQDSELVDMLAPNSNWSEPELKDHLSKSNSIMPMGNYDYPKMQMPIVTLQEGDSLLTDYHLIESVLYIRCYNSSQKSYFEINKILDRIIKLLHRSELSLHDTRFVELIWQVSSTEMFDEGYKLPYRELRFVLNRV